MNGDHLSYLGFCACAMHMEFVTYFYMLVPC